MEFACKTKSLNSEEESGRDSENLILEKKAFRNLKKTYDKFHVHFFKALKRFKITGTQFDLLETLLLSKKGSLSIQDLSGRMVTLQPNITRTVAGLEHAGLLKREKSENDRRIVLVRLTDDGYQLIEKIRVALLELHKAQFAHLSEDELRVFIYLLEKVRYPEQIGDYGDL
jgi:DNA-binding MarR family transcriptional regulator